MSLRILIKDRMLAQSAHLCKASNRRRENCGRDTTIYRDIDIDIDYRNSTSSYSTTDGISKYKLLPCTASAYSPDRFTDNFK